MALCLSFISGLLTAAIVLYLFDIARKISKAKKRLADVPGTVTSNDLLSSYDCLENILRMVPKSLRYRPPFSDIARLENKLADWHRVLFIQEMESGIIMSVATAGFLLEAAETWYSVLSKEIVFDDPKAFKMWMNFRTRRIATLSFVVMHLIDWYDYNMDDLRHQSVYWTKIRELIGESSGKSVLSGINERQLAGTKVIASACRLKDILMSGTDEPHDDAVITAIKELATESRRAYDMAWKNQKTLGRE
ncbi:MAG: hypothetical protein HGA31_01020 [Candidatus Moranbacteria bacterium]|nr:hypothetical protein [Candidatus Moranbacteria bacterium]